jgi:hypothetical protein
MSPLLFAWLAEVGIITWRDLGAKRSVLGLPPPGDYLATFIIFGSLIAIGSTKNGQTFANVAGWGLVIATALNVVDPTFVKAPGKQNVTTVPNTQSTNPTGKGP